MASHYGFRHEMPEICYRSQVKEDIHGQLYQEKGYMPLLQQYL